MQEVRKGVKQIKRGERFKSRKQHLQRARRAVWLEYREQEKRRAGQSWGRGDGQIMTLGIIAETLAFTLNEMGAIGEV